MPLVKSKASCFIDCIDTALGVSAATIARDYKDVIGEATTHDPDVDAYHPSIVNQVLIERFGEGLTELDFRPVDAEGNEIAPDLTDRLTSWFKRPGLRCVVTGRRADGSPHANAFIHGLFFDSDGTELLEPNISLLAIWCLGIPKHGEQF
jgi:hypothetical protein